MNKTQLNHSLLAASLLFIAFGGWSQDRRPVDILNVDNIYYDARVVEAERLIGNVRLLYEGAFLNCDSAWRFPSGDFEAFSNVFVNQGDTIKLYGDYLYLTRGDRVVRLRDNIRLYDREMTLTTDRLNYNLATGQANYFDGGVIRSTENQNVLKSKFGQYNKNTAFFYFKKDVVLTNPEYEIFSDTMRYHNPSEIAYFDGPTTIVSTDATIYCNQGFFNTQTEESRFSNGAQVHSGTNVLKGDSLAYNSRTNFGEVFRNVFMRDTTSSYYITGEYGWHDDVLRRSLVTDSAVMVQAMENDTLFLHADTLKAVPDSLDRRIILAYQRAKFFKEDLQGKCDSLIYFEGDSTITMFGQPLLWSDENQISGKTIKLYMYGGQIHRMYINSEALVVSEVSETAFNQIAGRELTGYFIDNALRKIDVSGNGQVVYYPEDDATGEVIGVNRADCSELTIYVADKRINRVVMHRKPVGALHPLGKAGQTDRYLNAYFWDTENRPPDRNGIFYWPSPEVSID